MITARLGPFVLATVTVVAPLAAQQSAVPSDTATTPSACLSAASKWLNTTYFAQRDSGKTPDYAGLRTASQAYARRCAAKFAIGSVPAAQLTDLSNLYFYYGDSTAARDALQHALAASDLTARQHAEAMLAAIRATNRAADPFAGRVAASEAYVRKIDALPDSLDDVKLDAHLQMLGQYEYADVDDGIQEHATVALALARKLNDRRGMLSAYASLVRAAADYLHPDSALRLATAAERELGSGKDVDQYLGTLKSLYGLVGTRATPIVGEHWINAPDHPDTIPIAKGKVWLIQFTAHWCAPCRNSYPGMRSLAATFKHQPFETVFVTQLYGVVEGKRTSPADELAYDREYYPDRENVPFPVAITPNGNAMPTAESNEGRYRVLGIPEIVVVDKQGIIRQIVTGWDHGNTARLTALIERLENEAGT